MSRVKVEKVPPEMDVKWVLAVLLFNREYKI